MKKILIAAIMLFSVSTHANIAITTTSIDFDANDANRNRQITFTNISDEEQTYSIKLINYKQMRDGSFEIVEQAPKGYNFANAYLILSPNRVTLKPGEAQIIRIQRKPMATVPNGEYTAHLIISETQHNAPAEQADNSKSLQFNVRALYSVSVPVIIRKGDYRNICKVIECKATEKDGQQYLTLLLSRMGDFSALVSLKAYNANGEQIGLINNVRIHHYNNFREIMMPISVYKKDEKITIEMTDTYTNEIIHTANFTI